MPGYVIPAPPSESAGNFYMQWPISLGICREVAASEIVSCKFSENNVIFERTIQHKLFMDAKKFAFLQNVMKDPSVRFNLEFKLPIDKQQVNNFPALESM